MQLYFRTEGAIMKRMKAALTLTLILFGTAANAPAFAGNHGGSVRFGIFVGGPVYVPWFYGPYYPYGYPPAVVAVPASPPVYVEQGNPQAAPGPAPQTQGYWYFCAESKTYYPYVKECPGGWQRVTPQPASGG